MTHGVWGHAISNIDVRAAGIIEKLYDNSSYTKGNMYALHYWLGTELQSSKQELSHKLS